MIERLVNILSWLDSDSITDWQTKLARDRGILIAANCPTEQSPLGQVLTWWEAIKTEGEHNAIGAQVQQFFFLSNVVTGIAGSAAGAGVAAAVLFYDGGAPINVFWAFLWLVALPLATLLLSLFIPWSKSTGLLRELNVARLLQSFLAMIRKSNPGHFITPLSSFDSFIRWRLASASQLFGLTFAIAALIVLLIKVTLSDLAFAWGSSLQINNEFVAHVTTILSAPWSHIAPQAVPDAALIDSSRYFRLGDSDDVELAKVLTRWWPFLAMSIVTYGVLLRTILLILASLQARGRLRRDFIEQPEVAALIARLNTPVLDVDAGYSQQPSRETVAVAKSSPLNISPAALVSWQRATIPKSYAGLNSFEINRATQVSEASAELLNLVRDEGALLLVTKGWEPPLLEFHDLIASLRAVIGVAAPIVVLPVNEQGETGREDHKSIWRESLAGLNDPQLFVQ